MNIYQKKINRKTKPYLDCSIDPKPQGINRLFVLFFANEKDTNVNTEYYLPKVKIKDYNIMIDGKIFF